MWPRRRRPLRSNGVAERGSCSAVAAWCGEIGLGKRPGSPIKGGGRGLGVRAAKGKPARIAAVMGVARGKRVEPLLREISGSVKLLEDQVEAGKWVCGVGVAHVQRRGERG